MHIFSLYTATMQRFINIGSSDKAELCLRDILTEEEMDGHTGLFLYINPYKPSKPGFAVGIINNKGTKL